MNRNSSSESDFSDINTSSKTKSNSNLLLSSLISQKSSTLSTNTSSLSNFEDIAINYTNSHSNTVTANGIDNIFSLKEQFLKEAIHYLKKLSLKGYINAQYLLADSYSSGCLSKINNKEAFALFQAAAKHGHIESAYRTAHCYEEGLGTNRDSHKSIEFLKFAASRNHPSAMFKLGLYSFYGKMGLPNDINTKQNGIKWLTRAVGRANPLICAAPYELAKIHENGFLDLIIPDEKYAIDLYILASSLGHTKSCTELGKIYENGNSVVEPNSILSVHYYTTAALQDDPEAQLSLCAWYLIGAEPALERDEHEAFSWALKAAKMGYPKAQYSLGYFYEKGIGTLKDLTDAFKWYERAAKNKDPRALKKLKKTENQVFASTEKFSIKLSNLLSRNSKIVGGNTYNYIIDQDSENNNCETSIEKHQDKTVIDIIDKNDTSDDEHNNDGISTELASSEKELRITNNTDKNPHINNHQPPSSSSTSASSGSYNTADQKLSYDNEYDIPRDETIIASVNNINSLNPQTNSFAKVNITNTRNDKNSSDSNQNAFHYPITNTIYDAGNTSNTDSFEKIGSEPNFVYTVDTNNNYINEKTLNTPLPEVNLAQTNSNSSSDQMSGNNQTVGTNTTAITPPLPSNSSSSDSLGKSPKSSFKLMKSFKNNFKNNKLTKELNTRKEKNDCLIM
ncbi:uncharacterized protein SCODWIG_02794 [Saccharomycodes ludwigii]|uniref:Protein SKT5 n=1 Tax=Saccharomycodes ludwigii TaxID=36035 RepID=A0A376B8L1_9ASCO|nr:uncharacterized protein SCODWIG_02794 [Saccharomycodes ludwigii]